MATSQKTTLDVPDAVYEAAENPSFLATFVQQYAAATHSAAALAWHDQSFRHAHIGFEPFVQRLYEWSMTR